VSGVVWGWGGGRVGGKGGWRENGLAGYPQDDTGRGPEGTDAEMGGESRLIQGGGEM